MSPRRLLYHPPPPGKESKSKDNGDPNYGYLCFSDTLIRDIAFLSLAGRWGFIWWLSYGDGFNVTQSVISSFPGDSERLFNLISALPTHHDDDLATERAKRAVELSICLKNELPKHVGWTNKVGQRVGRFKMGDPEIRAITDEADLILAKLWEIEFAYEAAGNLRDRMVFGNKE